MSNRNPLDYSLNKPLIRSLNPINYLFKDLPLFLALLILLSFGLLMLFSASGQSTGMVSRLLSFILVGFVLLLSISHLIPRSY